MHAPAAIPSVTDGIAPPPLGRGRPTEWRRASLAMRLALVHLGAFPLALLALHWGGAGGLLAVVAAAAAAGVAMAARAMRGVVSLRAAVSRLSLADEAPRLTGLTGGDGQVDALRAVVEGLVHELGEERARVRDLWRHLVRTADAERAELSRELFDSTAQVLAALLLEVSVLRREAHEAEVIERLERVRRLASDVLDEVRTIAEGVHPHVLDDLGLGAALHRLARGARTFGDATIDVSAGGRDDRTLSPDVAAVLYRVAHEAMTNAARHARARRIDVSLHVGDGQATVEVRDDGIGFQREDVGRVGERLGLFTMRERLAQVGGSLDVTSIPGQGTWVLAAVPVARGADAAHDAPAVLAGVGGMDTTITGNA